jgi:hypothetical protein
MSGFFGRVGGRPFPGSELIPKGGAEVFHRYGILVYPHGTSQRKPW